MAAAVIVTQRLRAAIDDHGSRSDIRAVSAQTQLPLAPVAGSESFYVDLALQHSWAIVDSAGGAKARIGS